MRAISKEEAAALTAAVTRINVEVQRRRSLGMPILHATTMKPAYVPFVAFAKPVTETPIPAAETPVPKPTAETTAPDVKPAAETPIPDVKPAAETPIPDVKPAAETPIPDVKPAEDPVPDIKPSAETPVPEPGLEIVPAPYQKPAPTVRSMSDGSVIMCDTTPERHPERLAAAKENNEQGMYLENLCPEDLKDGNVSSACRKAALRYHPDRAEYKTVDPDGDLFKLVNHGCDEMKDTNADLDHELEEIEDLTKKQTELALVRKDIADAQINKKKTATNDRDLLDALTKQSEDKQLWLKSMLEAIKREHDAMRASALARARPSTPKMLTNGPGLKDQADQPAMKDLSDEKLRREQELERIDRELQEARDILAAELEADEEEERALTERREADSKRLEEEREAEAKRLEEEREADSKRLEEEREATDLREAEAKRLEKEREATDLREAEAKRLEEEREATDLREAEAKRLEEEREATDLREAEAKRLEEEREAKRLEEERVATEREAEAKRLEEERAATEREAEAKRLEEERAATEREAEAKRLEEERAATEREAEAKRLEEEREATEREAKRLEEEREAEAERLEEEREATFGLVEVGQRRSADPNFSNRTFTYNDASRYTQATNVYYKQLQDDPEYTDKPILLSQETKDLLTRLAAYPLHATRIKYSDPAVAKRYAHVRDDIVRAYRDLSGPPSLVSFLMLGVDEMNGGNFTQNPLFPYYMVEVVLALSVLMTSGPEFARFVTYCEKSAPEKVKPLLKARAAIMALESGEPPEYVNWNCVSDFMNKYAEVDMKQIPVFSVRFSGNRPSFS
jgi:hypothetical protein